MERIETLKMPVLVCVLRSTAEISFLQQSSNLQTKTVELLTEQPAGAHRLHAELLTSALCLWLEQVVQSAS